MKITLWEKQASAFLECKAEYMKPNVILIVTSTSAKSMQGTTLNTVNRILIVSYPFNIIYILKTLLAPAGDTVLWSSSSTQYFFNIEHPYVVELRKNYKTEE